MKKYNNLLNSNFIHSNVLNVCSSCGTRASKATHPNKKEHSFSVSTFNKGKCDFCKKETSITQVRDFFYPDFNLINEEFYE